MPENVRRSITIEVARGLWRPVACRARQNSLRRPLGLRVQEPNYVCVSVEVVPQDIGSTVAIKVTV